MKDSQMKQFLLCILLTVVSAIFGYLLRMSAHDCNKGVAPVVLEEVLNNKTK